MPCLPPTYFEVDGRHRITAGMLRLGRSYFVPVALRARHFPARRVRIRIVSQGMVSGVDRCLALRALRVSYNRPAMSYDYDLIVAGAGSGGSVVAARVSEDPRIRVLLIESGPDYPNAESLPEDLRNVNHASFNDHDWGLTYTPSATSRTLPFTRGRVVGGSSAVNTAIALRGVPDDYDEWAPPRQPALVLGARPPGLHPPRDRPRLSGRSLPRQDRPHTHSPPHAATSSSPSRPPAWTRSARPVTPNAPTTTTPNRPASARTR